MECREDALKATKDSANGFLFIAAIQGGVGVFLDPLVLVDAAILAFFAAILRTCHSRVAAILLFLISFSLVVITTLHKLGVPQGGGGGSNIALAFIALWAAKRAVQATFLLHGRFSEQGSRSQGGLD